MFFPFVQYLSYRLVAMIAAETHDDILFRQYQWDYFRTYITMHKSTILSDPCPEHHQKGALLCNLSISCKQITAAIHALLPNCWIYTVQKTQLGLVFGWLAKSTKRSHG